MVFRGTFRLAIWVVLATLGIAFAVLRFDLLQAFLPTAQDSVTGAEPGLPALAVAKDGPGQYLFDGPEGLRAEGPIAALVGNHPVFIDDVITGYRTRIASDIPAEVTTIRPISGCRLTPPAKGTIVGHATAGQSGLALPLSTYGDAELAAAVQLFVDAYRAEGAAPAATAEGPGYEAYDVAVTETRAPVYLVLENAAGNRIWNIHLAEGARIERVVLLGGDQAGIANIDPVVPVEVILGDGLAECGIAPAYPPNDRHRLRQAASDGATAETEAAKASLATMEAAAASYDTWFRDSFGLRAGDSRAGFDAGTLSVIGPVPGAADPKAAYAAIQGAKIRTTQDTYFEIRGQVQKGGDFAARVRAIATTFAFGDLGYLVQGANF